MERSPAIKHHIPPMIIFFAVLIALLLISYITDYIMVHYGCCGRRGGCFRPEVQQRNIDNNDDVDIEMGLREDIPLETFNTTNDN